MNRRALARSIITALVLGVIGTGTATAGGPTRHGDAYTDTFVDDFIFDLCGIATMTTVTERFSVKTFADGSQIVHANREFVPADVRIPIEVGAADVLLRA